MDQIKNKLKNKNFQKKLLIYIIIFLAIIFIINWLVKSGQADRNKNQTENFSAYYKQLLSQCGREKEVYSCCFNSVALMAANNYKLAGIGCQPGFKLNTFDCAGAYKWCEMKR